MKFINELIYIPIWWIAKKPKITLAKIVLFTKSRFRSLGIIFLIRNIHKPLFGFTSIIDHIISLIVRIGHFLIMIFVFLVSLYFYIAVNSLVLVMPILVPYLIYYGEMNNYKPISILVLIITICITYYFERNFTLTESSLRNKSKSSNVSFYTAIKYLDSDLKKYLRLVNEGIIQNSLNSLMQSIIKSEKIVHIFNLLEIDIKKYNFSNTSTQALDIKNLVISAFNFAWLNNHKNVSLDAFLIAILKNKMSSELLNDMEITLEELQFAVIFNRKQEAFEKKSNSSKMWSLINPTTKMNRGMTGRLSPIVDKLTLDLTQESKKLKYSNIVGREKQYNRLIKSLAEKKYPLIIGNEGSGKTNLINYFAQKISIGEVPIFLQDKRVVQLNVSNLLSGIENSSESDANKFLVSIIEEISRAGHIILIIDEISNLYGIKHSNSAKFDLLQSLVENSKSSNITLLATTSQANYDKYLLNDPSTLSSFQAVVFENLSNDNISNILSIKAAEIAESNNKKLTIQALDKIKLLANRFINNVDSPSKEIQILNSAVNQSNTKYVNTENVLSAIKETYGIDLNKNTKQSEKLIALESTLHQEIIGQKEAVKAISDALRRASLDLGDSSGPLASFMFLGPTGVGKTELAKVTARTFFNSKNNFLRIDMSEYPDKKSIYKLIGYNSENGYIPGTLTEPIKSRPFSLVLFDELEKADPEVLDIFLQLLDDGIITDGLGNQVNFKNTIIIATSNVGNQIIHEKFQSNISYSDIQQEIKNIILPTKFRLEFINRFSRIITFLPLDSSEISEVSNLVMKKITSQLRIKGIELSYDNDINRVIVEQAYNPLYGARNIKNFLRETVNNFVAKKLLTDTSRKPIIHFGMKDVLEAI